ncbi:hypothetical protein GGR09_000942 [Bartonella heixiaziensis]
MTGPRFSSVNAQSWTAHQNEALAFRVLAHATHKQKKPLILALLILLIVLICKYARPLNCLQAIVLSSLKLKEITANLSTASLSIAKPYRIYQ